MLNKMKITRTLGIFLVAALSIPSTLSYAQDRDRHEGRHYYHYHDRPAFGLHLSFVPENSFIVRAGGANYYYYDGLYYNRMGRDYVLVDPPIGAVVASIPPDYRFVMINGVNYYTDSGIFYVYTRYGYQVVPPPVVHTYSRQVIMAQPVEMVAERQNQTKVAEGSWLGGIFGALLGGIVGHQQKGHHELGGALIGGAAGAVTGGIVGAQIPNENASPAVTQPYPAVAAPPASAMPAATIGQESPDGSFTVNIANAQGGYTAVIIKRSGNGFVGPQGEYYAEFPKVSQLQAMYSK